MLRLAVVVLVVSQSMVVAASPRQTSERLRSHAPAASADFDGARGVARFVRTPAGVPGYEAALDPRTAARAFFREYGDLLGVDNATADLHLRGMNTDALGHTHLEFEQRYHGLPVYGTSIRAHFDATGRLTLTQAASVPRLFLPTIRPGFSAAEAGFTATNHAGAGSAAGSIGLQVFDVGLVDKRGARPRLAYVVEVGGPSHARTVFVDAQDGAILMATSKIHNMLERAMYEFEVAPGSLVWQESDGPYLGNDPQIQGLVDYTEDTYNIYLNVSGGLYPSFDGESATMIGVLYDSLLDDPNAYWNGTFTGYYDGWATDDIVAHEWTHAYTDKTHDLIYAFQPGALNESYSDIFGESVDLLNGAGLDEPGQARAVETCWSAGDSVRWLQAEDVPGGAVRDMWTPSCMGQPDRVGSVEYYCVSDRPFPASDNGGVHFNSGVPNHAYALLVDGGSYNGVDVPAIGMPKALALYWRAMMVYQGQMSGFAEHAASLVSACDDLLGTEVFDPLTGVPVPGAIESDDCDAVSAAMAATEMALENPCGSLPLLDPGPAPSRCNDGASATGLFAEDFEDGLGAWQVSYTANPKFEPRTWTLVDDLPDGRAGTAAFAPNDMWLGSCFTEDEAGVMHLDSPAVVLPDDDGPRVLSFSHWIASEPRLDGGNVKIMVNGGSFEIVPASAFSFNPYNDTLAGSYNPIGGEPAFTGTDESVPTGSWVQSVADLSGLTEPGDTVTLRFDFGVNSCAGFFGWYVDDVEITQCVGLDRGRGSTTGDGPGADSTDGAESTTTEQDMTAATDAAPEPPSSTGTDRGLPGRDSFGDNASGGGCNCVTASRPTTGAWLSLWVVVVALRRRRAMC